MPPAWDVDVPLTTLTERWRPRGSLLAGVGVLWLLATGAACSAPSSAPPGTPLIAVFDIASPKGGLVAKEIEVFTEQVASLVAASDEFRPVPRSALRQRLRTTGRRGKSTVRSCKDAPCQVEVGRKVSARKSLALRVERNLVGQCDVYASLYDLATTGADQRSRSRAGCTSDELRDSLQRAVCHVLARTTTAGGAEGAAFTEARAECLARAELAWVERRLDAYRATPVRYGSPTAMLDQERKLAEEALALRTAFDRLAALGRPRVTVAALCRAGAVYDAFADDMARAYRDATPPQALRQQGRAAEEAFRKTLQETTQRQQAPLRDRARELYQQCSKRAAELKVSCPQLEEARARLTALGAGTR